MGLKIVRHVIDLECLSALLVRKTAHETTVIGCDWNSRVFRTATFFTFEELLMLFCAHFLEDNSSNEYTCHQRWQVGYGHWRHRHCLSLAEYGKIESVYQTQ